MRSNTRKQPPGPPAHRTTPSAGHRLRGRRILVPSDGGLDSLAELLESEGGEALRCPLVTIMQAADPEPSRTWVRVLATARFQIVIFLTAEGVACLERTAAQAGIGEGFFAGLRRARVVTRGAMPACALYELGVPVELRSPEPTCSSVLESLRGWRLARQHVGVQLCGEESEAELVRFLHDAGAHPHAVEPHRRAPDAEDHRVHQLIAVIAREQLDAVVFTEPSQVERLFEIAQQRDLVAHLQAGLTRLHVNAVGSPVLACLDRFGVRVDAAPARTAPPGHLVDVLAARLGPAPT